MIVSLSSTSNFQNAFLLLFFLCRYPLHRAPQEHNERAVSGLRVHSRGPVLSTFTAATTTAEGEAQRLVTVGREDGSLMVWDLAV